MTDRENYSTSLRRGKNNLIGKCINSSTEIKNTQGNDLLELTHAVKGHFGISNEGEFIKRAPE